MLGCNFVKIKKLSFRSSPCALIRGIVGIKNVTLAEEHLHDHFPGCPVMPNALIIEGLAQTGGLLVSESQSYERRESCGT